LGGNCGDRSLPVPGICLLHLPYISNQPANLLMYTSHISHSGIICPLRPHSASLLKRIPFICTHYASPPHPSPCDAIQLKATSHFNISKHPIVIRFVSCSCLPVPRPEPLPITGFYVLRSCAFRHAHSRSSAFHICMSLVGDPVPHSGTEAPDSIAFLVSALQSSEAVTLSLTEALAAERLRVRVYCQHPCLRCVRWGDYHRESISWYCAHCDLEVADPPSCISGSTRKRPAECSPPPPPTN